MAERSKRIAAAEIFGAAMVIWGIFLAVELLSRGRMEMLLIAAGFAFFQACNAALESLLHRGAGILANVPVASVDIFINTAISFLHSTLLSISVGACVLVQYFLSSSLAEMLEFESLYSQSWYGAYTLLALSCGYFAYDQVDMLRRHLYQGPLPPLLVHHWLLLNCFTLALVRNVSINYLILTLVCEMHSFFLHWRRVSRMMGIRKLGTKAVTVEWFLNWITFFAARLLIHIVISVKLYDHAAIFPSKFELLLAASGMLGLNTLNVFLGLDLSKACFKEVRSKRA